MKYASLAVAVIALGAGITASGQNMVEYSQLPPKPAVTNKKAELPTNNASKSAAKPAQSPKASKENPPTPPPPAIFILSNGERLEASRYELTVDSVKIQDGPNERIIPLNSVNVKATLAANHERGLDLHIPTNSSQITISF